jgi:hypothetical protein
MAKQIYRKYILAWSSLRVLTYFKWVKKSPPGQNSIANTR